MNNSITLSNTTAQNLLYDKSHCLVNTVETKNIFYDNNNVSYKLSICTGAPSAEETPEERNKRLRGLVKKVILNGDVTVVLWNDGTKTIVRRDKNDVYDPEKAILACMAKKLYENTGIFNEVIEDAMEKRSFSDKALLQRLLKNQQQQIKHLKKQLRKMEDDNKE